MKRFADMTKPELLDELNILRKKYDEYKSRNLKLDMSRGKPSPEQLDLSSPMLDCLHRDDYISDGIDCRNYGVLDGLPEMKKIFAEMLDISADEVIVGSNSSLSMMFDNVAVNMSHGVRDGEPWQKQGKVKFICPVPGYDRHYTVCDYFHIRMLPVDMTPDGPDMDEVERLVSTDPMIKGMWCVPIFSNPDGCVYSDETVRRIASLRPAAPDFRIYWDNAYFIHHFRGERVVIPEIISECRKAGNDNMVYVFASFSKISFSGAGISMMASSKSNCEYIKKRLFVQTIGPDKLNQLRHIRFYKNAQGVYDHMERMAQILRPKFDSVITALEQNLGGRGIASWTNPSGGYFISFSSMDGCAKKIIDQCRSAGITMTDAGSTYPNNIDPHDKNIRIAPSYPSLDELKLAMEIFCVTAQLISVEKILSEYF